MDHCPLTAVFTLIAFSTVYKTERRLYFAVLDCVDICMSIYISLSPSLFTHWDNPAKTCLNQNRPSSWLSSRPCLPVIAPWPSSSYLSYTHLRLDSSPSTLDSQLSHWSFLAYLARQVHQLPRFSASSEHYFLAVTVVFSPTASACLNKNGQHNFNTLRSAQWAL